MAQQLVMNIVARGSLEPPYTYVAVLRCGDEVPVTRAGIRGIGGPDGALTLNCPKHKAAKKAPARPARVDRRAPKLVHPPIGSYEEKTHGKKRNKKRVAR